MEATLKTLRHDHVFVSSLHISQSRHRKLGRYPVSQKTIKKALAGPRRFQWNFAGWFGSTIGGTCWLAVSAIALAWMGKTDLFILSATSWLIMLALAAWLWLQRDKLYPFKALVIFLAVFSVVMPIVWFSSWDWPTNDMVPSLYWIRGFKAVSACSIAPLLMLGFSIGEYLTHPACATNDNTD